MPFENNREALILTELDCQCLAALRRGFKKVFQNVGEGFMAYQHPLFARFSPDMAKMIVPPSSSKALIRRQTKQQLPIRSTAPNVNPPISNTRTKEESDISQNMTLTQPAVLCSKQEPKLPPSVLIASLRWGNKMPISHDQPDAPPSVRIAALRRNDPTKPSHLINGPAEVTKAHAMMSNRPAKGKDARSGAPGFTGSHDVDIIDVDVPESMFQPGEKRHMYSVSQSNAVSVYGQAAETPKTKKGQIAATQPSEIIRSSRDDTRQQSVTSPSLVLPGNTFAPNIDNALMQRLAEKKRLLQAMVAERMINRAAVEATRAVYQIANPSRRLSALEHLACADPEQACRRQRIVLDRELALQTQKVQQLQRLQERRGVVDEELLRRQRLAAALYGSGKPNSAKLAPVVTPKKREPEAASRTQHSAEKHRKREPEAVPCTQFEEIQASTATLHGNAAYDTQPHINPFLYFQQQQLQQQQALALSGRLAFPVPSFAPGQTAPLYSDDAFQKLLQLKRLSRS
jgi:hypothetical protein